MPSAFLLEQLHALGELRACNAILSSSTMTQSSESKIAALTAKHEAGVTTTKHFYEQELQNLRAELAEKEIAPLKQELEKQVAGSEAQVATIEKLQGDIKAMEAKYKDYIKQLKLSHAQELYVARKIG
jgi:hypothetical protein